MRIPQTYIQHTKAGIHFAQAFFILIAGCLALAVLTKDGEASGATGFFFGLCFLTLPALIYQIMVPMWTRAWRFANVHAYAALDLAFTILWFAAFIAVAVWNSAGIRNSDKDNKDKSDEDGSCSYFAYGSASKCQVSKASVGLGVVVCLLFAVTGAISAYGVERLGVEDPSKDPWNADTDELDPAHDNPFNDSAHDERKAYGQQSRREHTGEYQRGA